MFLLMGKAINVILCAQAFLIWTYVYVQMDSSLWFDTINFVCSIIVYIEGSQQKFPNKIVYLSLSQGSNLALAYLLNASCFSQKAC